MGAVFFGWLIGKDRHPLQVLDNDLTEYRTIGDRISKARSNPTQTIIAYVQMYELIEHDVMMLDNNTLKLTRELAEYDSDFPEFHTETQKSITNVSNTKQRMALLKKQIAVAKKLATIESSEQGNIWTNEMLPLLEGEDKLDASMPTH